MPADFPHCCCDCGPYSVTLTIGDVTCHAGDVTIVAVPEPVSWTVTFPTWRMARAHARRAARNYPIEGLRLVRRGREIVVSIPSGECMPSVEDLFR